MISPSYIVAAASFIALGVSLYKDWKLESNNPGAKRVLGLHHGTQAIVVALALWSAVDSENSAKKQRIALLEKEATMTASKHFTEVLDTYNLELLPAASVIRDYANYQTSLEVMPSELRESFSWNKRVSTELEAQRISGLRSFAKLQSIAREVVSEGVQYQNYYPDAMTKWATRTLELREQDLPRILSGSTDGMAYAFLVGKATSTPIAKLHDAIKRIED